MDEIPRIQWSQLKEVRGRNRQGGGEKDVIPVTDGMRLMAAKNYRPQTDSNSRVDRALNATQEFSAYQQLRQTPLAPYIPEPYFLIQKPKVGVVGLAVEWREGEELHDLYPQKLLRIEEVDTIEQVFLQLVRDYHITLGTDMFMEANICFREQGWPRLWLAECKIRQGQNIEGYLNLLRASMNYLRQWYVRVG